jgi:hypothetical protein
MTTALDQLHTGGLVEEVIAIVSYPCIYRLSQTLRNTYSKIALANPAI